MCARKPCSPLATGIAALFQRDREKIAAGSDRAGSALRVHDWLQRHAFATSTALVAATGLTAPTVNAALADLERLGIAAEVPGRRRGRVHGYRDYVDFLNESTTPLAP
jgi:Fic family protein